MRLEKCVNKELGNQATKPPTKEEGPGAVHIRSPAEGEKEDRRKGAGR